MNIQSSGNVNASGSRKQTIKLNNLVIEDSSIGNINISSGRDRITIINGVEYPWVKGMKGNSVTQINDKIYIDGYELKDGIWKKTLKAFYYKNF